MSKRTIALATSLTPEDDAALLTAAALAARGGARLMSVHATSRDTDVSVSPRVSEFAERWGTPIEHVPLMHAFSDDVTDTVLDAIQLIGPSLVVVGTRGRSGWLQLFEASVAEGIARNIEVPTLVVPFGSRPIVDEASGQLGLARILLPVADVRAAQAAVRGADWLRREAGVEACELVLLHVGEEEATFDLPLASPGLRISKRSARGNLEERVVEIAAEIDAALVVMPTRGRDTILDALQGSRTERVLRHAGRPVLVVPY